MKFDPSKDPVACSARYSTRYGLNGVRIVEYRGEHYIAATNGKALSLVRCELDDGDDPGDRIYPREPFALARKGKGAKGALQLGCFATFGHANGSTTFDPIPDLRFPDVLGILPTRAPVEFRIGIDVAELVRIAKALGTDDVVIEYRHDLPLTIRRRDDDDGSIGAMMPLAMPKHVPNGIVGAMPQERSA